jgi:thiamine kinase-like enzyme
MKAVFQQRLPHFSQGARTITQCAIEHATFRPHRKARKVCLSVCYRLNVRDSNTRNEAIQRLYSKAYVGGRSRIEFEALRSSGSTVPPFTDTPIHIPDLDMIIWTFPNDPSLPHLPELVDPKTVTKYLPYTCLPTGLDGPEDVRDIVTEVVHYRPQSRCLVKYGLQWGSPENPQSTTIFGKTFDDHLGKEILNRLKYFWQRYLANANSLMIAEPLAYNDNVKTLWQKGLKGEPVQTVIDRHNYKKTLGSIARGLASLHESRLPNLPSISVGEQLIEVQKKAAKLSQALPQFAGSLRTIVRRLQHTAPEASHIPTQPIHFDFTIKQLLVCQDRVAFFDFDELALGDPLQDLGNFIVDLGFRNSDSQLLRSMIKVFCESYKHRVEWDVPLERLHWYMQLELINRAYRSYIQQRPGQTDVIDRILVSVQRGINHQYINVASGEEAIFA